jgi:Aldehyde dehydrogenase family
VINKIYIDGEFVTPHGTELFDLFNPATGQVIGQVRLADEVDDADLDEAVTNALGIGFVNSGQACVAGTRILVQENQVDEVLALVTKKVADFPETGRSAWHIPFRGIVSSVTANDRGGELVGWPALGSNEGCGSGDAGRSVNWHLFPERPGVTPQP